MSNFRSLAAAVAAITSVLAGAEAMADWIAALPHEANSGDVYASLAPERLIA